jgi:hypothetical protein
MGQQSLVEAGPAARKQNKAILMRWLAERFSLGLHLNAGLPRGHDLRPGRLLPVIAFRLARKQRGPSDTKALSAATISGLSRTPNSALMVALALGCAAAR